MRELTQGTRALLDELLALPERRVGFLRRRDPAAARLLSKIAEAREPAALPGVLSFVLADEPTARAASRAVSTLLAAVQTTQLPWLDERLRQRSRYRGGWWGMRPRDLKRFDRLGEGAAALLQLATMHPSGFVRQEAVRALSRRSGHADSLPFFLIRRNDWVEPVRHAAIEALDRSTTADNAEAIVAALPLVFRLEACARVDHGPFVDEVRRLLARPECERALRTGIASADPRVRRCCFSLAFESSSLSRAALIRAGLLDRDPIVRLGAARAAVGSRPEDLVELLDRMERDPSTAVRRVGLDARIELFPEGAAAANERHLLDRSVSIRARAQRALRSSSNPVPGIYRDRIQSDGARALDIAILGLSEVGGPEDADLASGFLGHPLPRVRAAAVRAVARLSADANLPVLHAALADESPRVSRAARAGFLAGRDSPDAEFLRDLLERAEYRHAKLNAILVAQALPRWERLRFLLGACAHPDAEVSERAGSGVERWLVTSNRAALKASAADVHEISGLLEESKARLPENTSAELSLLLRNLGEPGVEPSS